MAAFHTSSDGNLRILAVSGRLDLQSRKDLRDTIQSLLEGENSGDVLVVLERLDYMASAGRNCFSPDGRSAARAACCLGAAGRGKTSLRTGLFRHGLSIFDARREALAYFRGESGRLTDRSPAAGRESDHENSACRGGRALAGPAFNYNFSSLEPNLPGRRSRLQPTACSL
jgi:hypothetical protein